MRRLELLALEDKNLKRHQETLRRYAEAGGQQPNRIAGKSVDNRRSSSSETYAVRSGERSPHQLELVEMKLQARAEWVCALVAGWPAVHVVHGCSAENSAVTGRRC